MICSKCGYNNKEGNQFCIKCGQRIYYATPGGSSMGTTLKDGLLLQGRYRIVKQLGKGGMGVVYLANDNRFSNRICVVKEMMEFLLSESEKQKAVTRFNQEADLLAAINYPNVPQVYDRFSENDRHYLVMEFISGMDLKDILSEYTTQYNSPLPEEDIVIFFTQLCLTLKYLHNHKPAILHRDIKPSNILVTLEGRAKLVDFGIAKAIQTNTQGTSIGTQGYAAPEQYKGLADARTDIYALGATIHHLLTGRDPQMEAPFDYPSPRKLNANISQELSDIIDWMLSMSVDVRPLSADKIIERIKSIYPDIEQRVLNYTLENNKIFDIINKNLNKNKDEKVTTKNICAFCGYENKMSSKFCVKCGKPVGSSSINPSPAPVTVYNMDNKMIIPYNCRISNGYPESYKEVIKIPAKDGNIKVNIIVERYFIDGIEFIYITEKASSIINQEVSVFNVVRNTQGAIQYIKPVADPSVRSKLSLHWQQLIGI